MNNDFDDPKERCDGYSRGIAMWWRRCQAVVQSTARGNGNTIDIVSRVSWCCESRLIFFVYANHIYIYM